jgi:hypothetical protein
MPNAIEAKCPHCGAKGYVTLPPIGKINIAPCPRCNELIVVFQGCAFPLDRETMTYGTVQEKRRHLCSTLTQYLKEQIEDLIPDDPDDHALDTSPVIERRKKRRVRNIKPSRRNPNDPLITESEIADFVRIDLRLVDKEEYFNQVFGQLPEPE